MQVRDVGDWICFPETVHELYAHLAELIGNINFGGFGFISLPLLYTELNGNKGLKNLSEENLEVIIKYLSFILCEYQLYISENQPKL